MKNHTSIHQFQSIHEPFWLNHSCTQLPNLTCYHYHDGCEIYLFLQGNAVMYVESQAFPLERGDLFVFGPDELHRSYCLDDRIYERYTLHLQTEFLQHHSTPQTDLSGCFSQRSMGLGNKRHLREDELQEVLFLLRRLENNLHSTSYGDDLLTSFALTELLLKINLQYQTYQQHTPSHMTPLVQNTMTYIETHLTEPISLQDLSDALFHNKTYISRKFKETTGMTIRDFILCKRIILAKSLLLKGEPLTTVCEASGFHDYSNFSRTFSQQVGCSPGKFQKRKTE